MMWNPVTRILNAKAQRGVKIIALSLLGLLASTLPLMVYLAFAHEGSNPVLLSWLFIGGAVLAHVGFTLGLLVLIYDTYWRR